LLREKKKIRGGGDWGGGACRKREAKKENNNWGQGAPRPRGGPGRRRGWLVVRSLCGFPDRDLERGGAQKLRGGGEKKNFGEKV